MLGLVVFVSIFVQLILGYLHHLIFKQSGSKNFVTAIHKIVGWVVMVAGWVNTALLVHLSRVY